MKKILICITSILLLFIIIGIASVIIYQSPIKIKKEFTAHYYGSTAELENETVECTLRLEYRRYLFKDDEIHGSIFIDGKEYYSGTGYTNKDGKRDKIVTPQGFSGESNLKTDGTKIPHLFYLAENVEQDKKDLINDYLMLRCDETFEYFSVVLKLSDHENSLMETFYGPAESTEEALVAYNRFFPE